MKAFPRNIDNKGYQDDYSGMDLRDYFAAKALQGYLACKGWHPDFDMAFDQDYAEKGKTAFVLSKVCYQMADAMMKARENDS
jgi:hypothetical protein